MISRRSLLAVPLVAADGGKIRIGFLGGSHSHAWAKFQVAQRSPHFEIAGVCEADAAVRSQYEKAGAPILSRKELLGDRTIHVVAVESAVRSHGQDGLDVLSAGKHLHLEKPPADTVAMVRRQVALAREKKLLIQSGYMWRHNPAVNRALDAARSGTLGEIYSIRACMNTLIDAGRRPDWAEFSGGQMFEQGAHLIDIMVRLMGKPSRVTSILRRDGKYADDMKDNTAAILEWPRALGVVLASTLQPNASQHRYLEILGAKGTAVVRPIEPPTLFMDLAGGAKSDTVQFPYARYAGDFEELATCLKSGRPLPVTLEQEVEIQETLLLASKMPG